MRALMIGIVLGASIACALVLLLMFGGIADPTGAIIASSGSTVTLPASSNDATADLIIASGSITPVELEVPLGKAVTVSVFARTGPARLMIPAATASTPLLSERQLHTFRIEAREPGRHEVICNPCGSTGSLQNIHIITGDP